FDHAFYQECMDTIAQRGDPVSSDPFSVLTCLRHGTVYGATAGAHLSGTDRALQIWIAIFTGYAICIDDMPERFPEEMQNIRAFNDRFVRGEKQGNAVLDAFADTLREIPRVFGGSVPANLVTTSILNFVTANVIEWETRDMQILATAKQYPTYQRTLSGIAEAYAFMVFPSDLPFGQYIQAIPEMTHFIHGLNDILSFYKEELAGETGGQIPMIAARKGISRIEAFEELADNTGELYDRIVSILDSLSRICEAFKQYAVGYVWFHTSLERYRLAEMGL
ncbi:isoprenoid synthase domain-containing protein, partial [Melanogaster broomeanus]